jgi:hypothetical protein
MQWSLASSEFPSGNGLVGLCGTVTTPVDRRVLDQKPMFSRSVLRFFSCIFFVASASRCLALSQHAHIQEPSEFAI